MDSTHTTLLIPQSATLDSGPRNLPAQVDSTPVRQVAPQSNSVDPAARNPSTMADPTLKSNQTCSVPIYMSSAEPPRSMCSGAPSGGKIVQSEVEDEQRRLEINYYEARMEASLALFLRIQKVYLCFLMVIIFRLVKATDSKSCSSMAPPVIGLLTLYPFVGFPGSMEINNLYSLRSLRADLVSGEEKERDCEDWYDRKYRFRVYFIGHCSLVVLNVLALIACLPLLKEACF